MADKGADEQTARASVQRIKRAGYDFVKVYSGLPRESFFAAIDEMKRQGIPFAGHVPAALNAGEASEAGQRSTATFNPAKYLGMLDSLGAIEPGKLADLALLDADPLEDISIIAENTSSTQPIALTQTTMPPTIDVRLVNDEAEAVLAILAKRDARQTITEADWQRVFSSEGYVRLKQRFEFPSQEPGKVYIGDGQLKDGVIVGRIQFGEEQSSFHLVRLPEISGKLYESYGCHDCHHMEQFAHFIQKLKTIQEGDGSLLDHCMIVYGSILSDSNTHSLD